jgi:hypothetical protein
VTYYSVRQRPIEGRWQAVRVFPDNEDAAFAFAARLIEERPGFQIEVISWTEATKGRSRS